MKKKLIEAPNLLAPHSLCFQGIQCFFILMTIALAYRQRGYDEPLYYGLVCAPETFIVCYTEGRAHAGCSFSGKGNEAEMKPDARTHEEGDAGI